MTEAGWEGAGVIFRNEEVTAGGVLARGEDRKGKEESRFSLGVQIGDWTPKWCQSAAGVPDP